MYGVTQTLYHKETKKLVRLDILKIDSIWAWDIGYNTRFVDKEGNVFLDDIKNYACIEDEFGRPYSNPPRKGQHVDESAGKYVNLTQGQRMRLRRKSAIEWERKILDKMAKEDYILCPFADGSMCPYMYNYFMKRRKAKPVWVSSSLYRAPMMFKYNNKVWIYQNNRLEAIKLNSL